MEGVLRKEALSKDDPSKVDLSNDDPGKDAWDFNKLEKRLRHEVGRAIEDFGMIEEGDKVMVCLSGGADSYTMLDMLQDWDRNHPGRIKTISSSMQTVVPSHLADNDMYDFKGIVSKT